MTNRAESIFNLDLCIYFHILSPLLFFYGRSLKRVNVNPAWSMPFGSLPPYVNVHRGATFVLMMGKPSATPISPTSSAISRCCRP